MIYMTIMSIYKYCSLSWQHNLWCTNFWCALQNYKLPLFYHDFYFYLADHLLVSQWWPSYPSIYLLNSLIFFGVVLNLFNDAFLKNSGFHLSLSVLFSPCLFWLIFLSQTTGASYIRCCFSWLVHVFSSDSWNTGNPPGGGR